MFGMWSVGNVRCSEYGMFGVWYVWDVGCSGCGMFEMWDVQHERCLGCEMLVYKMPNFNGLKEIKKLLKESNWKLFTKI